MIGQWLHRFRTHRKMTQDQLVLALMNFSESFARLNTVTVSRWETGRTTPGVGKKREILRFLMKEGFLDEPWVREEMERLFRRHRGRILEAAGKGFHHIVGNFPELEEGCSEQWELDSTERSDRHLEQIVEIERAMGERGYSRLELVRLKEWLEASDHLALVCGRKGQHTGHCLIFRLSREAAGEILHNRRSWYDLSAKDFRKRGEPGTMFFAALYARSPQVLARLLERHYRFLLERHYLVDGVVVHTTREDEILSLTSEYGLEVADSGKLPSGLPWYGLYATLEDLLFSEEIVRNYF